MQAVGCNACQGGEPRWRDMGPMPQFGPFGQGEYVGPARSAHVDRYQLRPGDQLIIQYMFDNRPSSKPYELMVGDEVLIEVEGDDGTLRRGDFNRGLVIQPDGTITVRYVGQVQAAGLTVPELRALLQKKYVNLLKEETSPVDVTPVRVNTLRDDIVASAGGRAGFAPAQLTRTVAPDGTIQLPKLGSVCVQGLSLCELKQELNLRYREFVSGLEIDPAFGARAPTRIFILGQVASPGEKPLTGPTTALSALALGGGPLQGGNLRQVVVMRRTEDWRLVSTMLDLRGAFLGKRPIPSDEIWLRDNDVVIVPATPIEVFDQFVQQVFTNGIYRVVPFGGVSVNFGNQNN
jgi:polysaccharide biosynthesis/export protein